MCLRLIAETDTRSVGELCCGQTYKQTNKQRDRQTYGLKNPTHAGHGDRYSYFTISQRNNNNKNTFLLTSQDIIPANSQATFAVSVQSVEIFLND